jgi:hypothetical protein
MSKTSQVKNQKLAELLRPDGRPEVYDVAPHGAGQNVGYICFICQSQGHLERRFDSGEVFMTSPVNTPDNATLLVCKEHLPDNAVIFSPFTGKCRDKSGENEWKE